MMGKKNDETIARLHEIEAAIVAATKRLADGTPAGAKATVVMTGAGAGVAVGTLVSAVDGDLADKDADEVAEAIIAGMALASAFGALMG